MRINIYNINDESKLDRYLTFYINANATAELLLCEYIWRRDITLSLCKMYLLTAMAIAKENDKKKKTLIKL